MAEVSSTKVKEKKVDALLKDTPSNASKEVSGGVSVMIGEAPKKLSLEEEVVKAFKDEFKGMPYTELHVVVQCGNRTAPTYQEIELPMVAELLKEHQAH